WYRRLFLFPNLAYVMGGLVLVFGGLITISLLRTTMSDGSVAVSQATDTQPAARGPMSLDEPAYSSSANMASNAANAAAANTTHTVNSNSASTTSSSAAANAPGTGTLGETSVAREEVDKENRPDAGVTLDGVDAAKPAAAAPLPAPVATPEGYARERSPKDLDDSKKEDKLSARSVTEPEAKKRAADENLLKSAPRSQAGGPAKSKSGASRDAQQQFPDRANNTYDFPITKNVSGKGFQFRNGAWYDNAYRGQSTTNIRRRTDEYKNLNSGVRVIAESLSGVVVVVWKDKAYRIQ
ncbi:MAG TPA: hypothetical protein VK612_08805, partial [Pyrinomonadaceae bacterium]|nr:hypothetical protein [Pyrinomonadaceae bacterium]